MKKFTVAAAILTCALTGAMIVESGCKSSQPSNSSAAAPPNQNAAQPNGGTLNSDGTITPSGQQPSQQPAQQAGAPQQSSSASATQPAIGSPPPPAAQRESPPPPPVPVALIAPIGTSVRVRTTETLSASHNDVGDGFTGVIDAPVVVDGKTLFATGTRVTGTVIAAKGRGRFKGSGALGIELSTIAGLRVQTNEYEREVKGKGKRTGTLIGGGAGLGAIIGGIVGGGKGAVIGGLAGAGAGTAGAAYTGNKDVVLPSESVVTFHLAAQLTLHR